MFFISARRLLMASFCSCRASISSRLRSRFCGLPSSSSFPSWSAGSPSNGVITLRWPFWVELHVLPFKPVFHIELCLLVLNLIFRTCQSGLFLRVFILPFLTGPKNHSKKNGKIQNTNVATRESRKKIRIHYRIFIFLWRILIFFLIFPCKYVCVLDFSIFSVMIFGFSQSLV